MKFLQIILLFTCLTLSGCANHNHAPVWRIDLISPHGKIVKQWKVKSHDKPSVTALWGGQTYLTGYNGVWAPNEWFLDIYREEVKQKKE